MQKEIEEIKKIVEHKRLEAFPVKLLAVSKKSRKELPTTDRSILSIPEVADIYLEHVDKTKTDQPYIPGGTGKVKKGFLDAKTPRPSQAIKIILRGREKAQQVINEAGIHLLLARRAFAAVINKKDGSKKYYLSMPWLGEDLFTYYNQELCDRINMGKPIPSVDSRRFDFLSLILETKIIHSWGLVLGDPKLENAMKDKSTGAIRWVDFDSVRWQGVSRGAFTFLTPNLLESIRKSKISDEKDLRVYINRIYSQADDIYLIGSMLGKLFPELFQVRSSEWPKIDFVKQYCFEGALYDQHKWFIDLVMQMTHPDPSQRPAITTIERFFSQHCPVSGLLANLCQALRKRAEDSDFIVKDILLQGWLDSDCPNKTKAAIQQLFPEIGEELEFMDECISESKKTISEDKPRPLPGQSITQATRDAIRQTGPQIFATKVKILLRSRSTPVLSTECLRQAPRQS